MANSPSTEKATRRVMAAAWSVLQSEIPSLRNRVADGYTVVEVSALERLRKNYDAARAKK